MKNIVLFGKPGSGKGTQASLIEKKYNFIHKHKLNQWECILVISYDLFVAHKHRQFQLMWARSI